VSSAGDEPFILQARGPYPRESVLASEEAPFAVDPEHEALVEQAWQKAVAAASASGRKLFPGAVMGFKGFATRGPLISLGLHRTDYRAFVGTNLSPEFRATGARCANALGISIIIVLASGRVLLHRRGDASFEWPLAIDTPGGHVEPDFHRDGGAPSIFAAAQDELEAELGIRRAEIAALSLLGLARIRETQKPQAIILARVAASFEEIGARIATARESFETSELLAPLALHELGALARSSEPVTPAGRAALTLAAELLPGLV
jgi:8-oxo-dGTP pyrophosphatase MutT (NUDIX family)